jgi:serine/threonine-protein kinase RsbW
VTDPSVASNRGADEVRLTLPPRPEFARIARLAVTGIAARLRFSYDDVEDLRIGVGEMCNILLEASGGALVVRCTLDDGEVRVIAERDDIATPLEVSDLSRQILDAFLVEVRIDAAGGRIEAVKRRSIDP